MKVLKVCNKAMVAAIAISMALCGSFISVLATNTDSGEMTEFVDYQFTCTVETVNKSCKECETVTVAEVVSDDSNPKVISGTNGIYQLEAGKKYKCTISGDKFQMPYVETESFTAETQKVFGKPNSHDIKIPIDYLKFDFQDTICFVGETISFDDWTEFGWVWSLDNAEDASKLQIKDSAGNCKMTGKETGKVSVSRRVYDSSNNEVYIQTKLITVEPKKTRFNIHYGTDVTKKINAVVEVKDGNNAVIDCQNGGYQLNAGQEHAAIARQGRTIVHPTHNAAEIRNRDRDRHLGIENGDVIDLRGSPDEAHAKGCKDVERFVGVTVRLACRDIDIFQRDILEPFAIS